MEFLSQNSEFMDFGKVIPISDVLCSFKGVIGRIIFFHLKNSIFGGFIINETVILPFEKLKILISST